MCAAEDQRVGVQVGDCGVFLQIVEVDADNLRGDCLAGGVFGPAFFDERDEQGAGALDAVEAEGAAGFGVGVAVDGGIGGDDEDVTGFGGSAGRGGSGLDDAENGDGDCFLNRVEG